MQSIKYPRTYHFPFSPGATNDDKIIPNLNCFLNKQIAITEKMDGENTTMTKEVIHARSLDSTNHDSRNWVKGLWGNIRYNIPNDWRICGENVYAKHAIFYEDLKSYFYVFNIWDENNTCLNLQDTLDWCKLLNLIHVDILYQGPFNIEFIQNFANKFNTTVYEGFVLRNIDSFNLNDFNKNIVKWVRKNHVNQNSSHWMYEKIILNKLRQ